MTVKVSKIRFIYYQFLKIQNTIRQRARQTIFFVTLYGTNFKRKAMERIEELFPRFEADGLALSSRNVRLTPEHRAAAPAIRCALLAAKEAYEAGAPAADVCHRVVDALFTIPGVKVDYVERVDAETLHELQDESRMSWLAVAAFFGEVRLSDNIELTRNA